MSSNPKDGTDEPHESDVTVAGKQLTGLHDDLGEEEDVEVMGFATFYTIGEFLEVPDAFIESQADEIGLREDVLPNDPTPKKAYNRTCDRLFLDVNNEPGGMFGKYAVNTENVDKATWLVRASWYDDDIEDFEDETIGELKYNYDNQSLVPRQRTTNPDLEWIWEEAESMARRKFQDMQETQLGSDLRQMVREIIGDQYSVKLRNAGAFYFVPANQSEEVRKAAELMDACNAFKKPGRPRAQVGMIEVIDTEEKRELVKGRVEAQLNEEVESTLNEAVERFEEEGKMTEEVEEEIEGLLEETLEETVDVAEQYNALLRVEMKVPEIVENLKANLHQEIQEVVEEVVEERQEEPATA